MTGDIEQKSGVLKRNLDAIQSLFDDAVAVEDTARVDKLSRIVAQMSSLLEKARLEEKTYVIREEVEDIMRRYAMDIIDLCKGRMSEDAWAEVVDTLIARSSGYGD